MNRDSLQAFLDSLDEESRINAKDAIQIDRCPVCGEKGLIQGWAWRGHPDYLQAVSCRQCSFDSLYPATWPRVVEEIPDS